MSGDAGVGDPSACGSRGVRVLRRGAAQPSLARCLCKTTNETRTRRGDVSFVPELRARRRLLCGHRLGAAGSPGNLIGGDRLSPGDNKSACSQRPQVLGSSASDWRTAPGAWVAATAARKRRSRHVPGTRDPVGLARAAGQAGRPLPTQPQQDNAEPSAWQVWQTPPVPRLGNGVQTALLLGTVQAANVSTFPRGTPVFTPLRRSLSQKPRETDARMHDRHGRDLGEPRGTPENAPCSPLLRPPTSQAPHLSGPYVFLCDGDKRRSLAAVSALESWGPSCLTPVPSTF